MYRVGQSNHWLVHLLSNQSCICQTYCEVIGEASSNWNRTLGYTGRSIHPIGARLEEAMEMDRCCLIAEFVIDVNDHSLADGNFNSGTRPFAIDANSWSAHTIWTCLNPCDVPVVSGLPPCEDHMDKKSHKETEI
jgi:hypothetical protein